MLKYVQFEYYYVIKEEPLNGECNMRGSIRNVYKILVENLQGKTFWG
jgi:hypothetical protein